MTETARRINDDREQLVATLVPGVRMNACGTNQHGRHGLAYIIHAWRCIGLLVFSVSLAAMAAWQHPRREHFAVEHWLVREVSVSGMDRILERLVVDARAREQYEKAHIAGAVLLSEETWDDDLPTFLEHWQPEHPVVIYCDGQACAASKRVALRLLKDLPEARVYVLKGGFPAWKAAQG